jgi:hypothetical protein
MTAKRESPSGRPHPATFAAAFATLIVMIVGSVGPWGYFSGDPSSDTAPITLYGIDRDGRVTLALAVGAALLLLAHRQVKGLSIGPLVGTIAVAAVCIIVLVVDLGDIRNRSLTVRWGIIVDLVGAALLVVATVALILQAPGRRAPASQAAIAADARAGLGAAPAPAWRAADWYPDPQGEARLRYWDGTRWTEHTAQ